jgi:hypothetical protein
MRPIQRALTLFLLTALLAAPWAAAVEPSYNDQFGNPEEPALRPITWLWHGTKTMLYRATHGVRQSREDPRFGNFLIESGKGRLQAVVDVGESVFRGAIHSTLPPKDSYKQLGSWNKWILDDFPREIGARKDLEGQTAAEAGVTYMPAPPGSPVVVPQEEIETAPFLTELPVVGSSEREPEAPKSVQPVYTLPDEDTQPNREMARSEATPVEQARERYLGDRARVNPAKPGRGNLLRLAR